MLPEKVQAARFKLINEKPYVAAALLSLQTIEFSGLETMGVDQKWRLYFDPKVAEKWDVDEIKAVLYHEVLHMLRSHHNRLGNFPNRIANIAADAEINDDLLEEGFKLPEKPITPAAINMPKGLLAEEYAEELMKRTEQEIQKILSDFTIADISSPKPGSGVCGSIATGTYEPWEEKDNESNVPGLTETELEIIKRNTAKEIRVYEQTHGRGSIPAHLSRWAEEILNPKVNWKRELAAVIKNTISSISGRVDYSYRRPARRQSTVKDIILPSMQQSVPNVVVVIDTSGSISGKMLGQAIAEVKGILHATELKDRIWYITCDAEVYATKQINSIKQIKLEGGGGTDMRKGIEAAERLKPRPDICIVLTDGYTPWPDTAPRGMKVIVGLINSEAKDVPPWAKMVNIKI
ncbi:vWA domain-containing protein [Thermoanaerobacter mathranii]|uniref:vWA domain-containing protein n=1 Tax=Thermoanaerobacter mathranii TaxID=583357 RepID=UPI003D6C6397